MENDRMLQQKMAEVAQRIRAVRDAVGLSVEDAAERTGVTPQEFVRIETGETDFNFTFVYKFAKACGVEMTDIMEGQSPILSEYTVTRKGEGMRIRRSHGCLYDHLAPMFKHKLAEPFFVTVPYSDEALEKPMYMATHKGQEFDIVLRGTLKMQLGEENFEVLHEGDTIYYNSDMPHGMVAMGGEDCQIYAVVMNPDAGVAAPEEQTAQGPVVTNTDRAGLKDPVYAPFISAEVDENGVLSSVSVQNEEKFNFAFDVVDAMARKDPGKLALLHLDREKHETRFTFKDMSEASSRAANYFASLGIRRGDRVMLVLRRNWQFWTAIIGLHKLGAVAIPATDQLVEHDYAYRFRAAGVRGIVCTSYGNTSYEAEKAAAGCPETEFLMMAGGAREGWLDFDAGCAAASPEFPRAADAPCGSDLALMFFTSGTTGYPKIAAHNYKYALGHFVTAKYWHNVDPNGLHFTIADTGWGKALWGKLYGQWLCEAPTLAYDFDRFSAADILPLFAKYNVTTFCAPPTMYRFFIKEDLSKFDLSSVRHATVAGEALNPEVYNQFLKATGVKLLEGFGQTETTLVIGNFLGADIRPGSMGRPSPLYQVELLDPDGAPTKVGEVGEICIRVDPKAPCGLFAGYFRDEEKTRAVWHDGFYHTGDTAWRDENGYFWFVGRVDDLIKSSGYRIGPFEIESVLMELPYVLECAVTAAPDPIRGQVVKATIVLTRGTEGTEELKKEIQDYVKKNTAPYKYPRIVEFRDALPKTASGKIRRTELREE